MPWQTLELDPATATARDVKRAYASRLKTCRPDQDPEGFRRLHDAYTAALDELQWQENSNSVVVPILSDNAELATGSTTSLPATAEVQQTSELPAAPALSPSLTAVVGVLERLDTALKDRTDGVATLVREAESVIRAHPSEVVRWGEIMHDLIRDHAAHEDLRLTPEAILFELEHHGVAATIAVIDRIDREGNSRGITGLSGLLAENKKRIATPAGGIAAARLASTAAFWAPGNVERLSDLAYETLARGERDFHMELIDRHASMRQFLSMIPDRLKSFFRQRLMDAGGREVWDTEEGAAAIAWLKTSQARATPVYEVIREQMPAEVARAAGLSALQPASSDTTTHSSSGSHGVNREWRGSRSHGRNAPKPKPRPNSRPNPKLRDEMEWEEDEAELATVPEPQARPAQIPQPKPKPKPAAEAASIPAARRQNWLDEEARPSQRSSGQRRHPQASSSGASRSAWTAIVAVIVVLKVIFLILKLLVFSSH